MEVVHERCAGLDVHQHTVVACVRVAGDGKVAQEVRTFDTTTQGLLALCDWIAEHGCTHAAMESTGVYWKPVWHAWRAPSNSCSPTRRTSATYRDARPT